MSRLLHALWPFLALLTFLFPSAAVKADSLSELGGKPFGNPSHITTMPAGWIEKPIVYANSAQGNEIVVTLDQHLYHTLLPIIQRYAEQQGLKIEVSEGICSISIGKLARKEVDIGGFCCPPGKTDSLLGLTIVYTVVRKHDGYIQVESRAGSGTTVFLYLPAADQEDSLIRGKAAM
jgi:hypothetical protein